MGVLDSITGANMIGRRLRQVLLQLFDTASGHNHDGTNSKATALQGSGAITSIRMGRVQLRGTAKTPLSFGADSAAQLTSTEHGPYDCTGVGSGGTILVDADDNGEDMATLEATAATSVSGASPSTDISLGADNKLLIAVNGGEPEEVALTLVNCDSGAKIAAEMQAQIRALVSGQGEDVTVVYTSVYTVTSPLLGTDSSVIITPAPLNNCSEELKLGALFGTETAGGGDCADLSAVTADEIVELCSGLAGDLVGCTVTQDEDDYLVITSDTEGIGSSLVMGDSTLKAVLGLAQAATAYGQQGLGYASNMANANYLAWAIVDGTAGDSLPALGLGINSRAAAGFELECETAASAVYVNVLVIGVAA